MNGYEVPEVNVDMPYSIRAWIKSHRQTWIA